MWPFIPGERFPYANFHSLNQDWILAVVKDFQDKYSNITQAIENGEAELNSVAAAKLAELNAAAQNMLTQLNAWYNSHSEDISQELESAILSFTTTANAIKDTVIASIPQEYSDLAESVINIKSLNDENSDIMAGNNSKPYLNIGYSINAQGEYFRAYGIENKRAASEMFAASLSGFKVELQSSGVTFNVYFYSTPDETSFVSSAGGPFTGEHIFTSPYSKYYRIVALSDSDLPSNINDILTVTNFSEFTDINSIIDIDKQAYYPIDFTINFGAITPNLSINDSVGEHAKIPVKPGEKYIIDGYVYSLSTYPLFFFRDYYTLISVYTGNEGKIRNYEVTVPDGAVWMYVNARPTSPYDMKIFKKIDTVSDMAKNNYYDKNLFINKKIVWYGTSIPANGFLGSDHPEAYPQQLGKLLNAEVINKSVGSSCIYCKDPTRINQNNPYGFLPNFESASRCLTNSIEEMQWIIDNYNSSIWTSHAPSQMTEELANQIKSFSYENMLLPYLTADTEPFIFVFDHGFNDSPDTHNYYQTYGNRNLYTYRGGMNFLIEKIFAFNPYANIIIIGNYDNRQDVQQMQKEVADDWSIPIIEQWKYLKFSRTETVTVYGQWVEQSGSYRWATDSTARTMTMKDRLIPDKIHPWSDPTGNNVKLMTEGLYREFLKIPFEN